jgi:hypothetical protein
VVEKRFERESLKKRRIEREKREKCEGKNVRIAGEERIMNYKTDVISLNEEVRQGPVDERYHRKQRLSFV